MKSIGLLYICTGPYEVFWDDFYNSFETNFLPNTNKEYYVFTDSVRLLNSGNRENVHIKYIDNQPWPLVTLLRFRTFLSVENELKKHDYLMFSNANIVCSNVVTEDEFLPRENLGEVMAFTHHPGYYKEKKENVPYDRNKKSSAYIPYNLGENYVIGALFAGCSIEFLEMCHILDNRICEDLKKGVIALWHDESHINRFIINKNNYRLLNPGYCYPVGIDVPYEKKIIGISKQDKFDVKAFKGQYKSTDSFIHRKRKSAITKVKKICNIIKDNCLRKKVEEL